MILEIGRNVTRRNSRRHGRLTQVLLAGDEAVAVFVVSVELISDEVVDHVLVALGVDERAKLLLVQAAISVGVGAGELVFRILLLLGQLGSLLWDVPCGG